MSSHPVELVYELLTSIVVPYMPEPEDVQGTCSCCQRPAEAFDYLGYRFKNCYQQSVKAILKNGRSRFITGIVLSPATFNHRNIARIIQRAGKIFQPRLNFPLVDIGHAHAFKTAPQFAGVLRRNDDTVFHHPNFNGHSVNKPGLRHPLAVQTNRMRHNA